MAETKTCAGCHESKPLSEFNRDSAARDGHRSRCALCMREARSKWRAQNPDRYQGHAQGYRERYPARIRANTAVRDALRAGKMARPTACQRCERSVRLHAHHDDYEFPLNVLWVCAQCHRDRHAELLSTKDTKPQ